MPKITVAEGILSPKQLEALPLLAGPARHCLLVGGSRSGKTFLLCRTMVIRALKGEGGRHGIFRQAFNHVKASVWQQTMPVVFAKCFPGLRVKQNKADFFWEFKNGSQIWIGGLDDKERTEKILGQEYVSIYLNEASQIGWPSVEMVKTRLAQVVPGLRQKLYVDCNPTLTNHWTHRLWVEHKSPNPPFDRLEDTTNYAWMRINPFDNRENLSPEFLADIEKLGPRARKRFWEGDWGAETENALWTFESFDKFRRKSHPDLQRIIIGVDPSGTKGAEEDSRTDQVGIVVAGLGTDGHAYVLEDLTAQVRPNIWGRMVATAYDRYQADVIVGEVNFGGAMVEDVIRSAASDLKIPINYREVTASRGKVIRAEPIATLYEQGKVHHVGDFTMLEDQLCNFTTAGYMGDRSPDRADALIWALSELFPGMTRRVSRFPLVIETSSTHFNPQRF